MRIPVSPSLPTLADPFNSGHPDWCEVASHCGFDLYFRWWFMMLSIFSCIYWPLCVFSGEMAVQILCTIFKWGYLSFYYWVCCCHLSCVQLLCDPMHGSCHAPVSSTVSWSLLKFVFVELVLLSNHLILCHPLLLLPSVIPSVGVFSSELAIQGCFPLGLTGLISLLSMGLSGFSSTTVRRHHILWHSPFFLVSFSHLYMTTGKAIALTFVKGHMDLCQQSGVSAF